MAHRGRSVPNTSAGNQLLGMVLKSSNPAIIVRNAPLPAHVRSGKGPPVLWLTPGILLHIRVRIWFSVELCNIELPRVEIVPIVPRNRHSGTNRVSPIRRGKSCSVEEASTSNGCAQGEMKPGIDLIVIDQFDLVGSIGGDLRTMNVTKNKDEKLGMVAVFKVPTSSFAELQQIVVLENRQPTVVWCCIPMHHLWELVSQPRIGTRGLNKSYSHWSLLMKGWLGTSTGTFTPRTGSWPTASTLSFLLLLVIRI